MACRRCIEACHRGALSDNGRRVAIDRSKCIFCGDCVAACPTAAREILGRQVTAPQLMAEIERDVIFFDQSGGGVTFSGGEPLAQAAFLREILVQCKQREIHTAVDTSCCAPWEVVEEISRHADLFLVDLKQMDPRAHERFTGVSNEPILQNVRRLARSAARMIIRIPVIPGVNDDEANVAAVADFVATLEGVERIDLLPHHQSAHGKLARLAAGHELLQVEPPAAEQVERMARRLSQGGFRVTIGG